MEDGKEFKFIEIRQIFRNVGAQIFDRGMLPPKWEGDGKGVNQVLIISDIQSLCLRVVDFKVAKLAKALKFFNNGGDYGSVAYSNRLSAYSSSLY